MIATLGGKEGKLAIYDARSYINALANKVHSGGFENTKDYYKGCDLVFCDIDNIHAVRNSMNAVQEIAEALTSQSAHTNMKVMSQIEGTNWLQLLSRILQAT
jgi:arginine/ornithine N-succinyltransferase beta subunit